MTGPASALEAAAEAWLLERFSDYRRDRSVMHVDVEVWLAGAKWAFAQSEFIAGFLHGPCDECGKEIGLAIRQYLARQLAGGGNVADTSEAGNVT